jgi:hypothetical protein
MNEEFVEAEFWSIVNEEYGDTQVVSFEQAYEIINPYPGIYVVIMEEYGKEKS